MNASSLCFRAVVPLVLAGMVWGLQMAISQDHSAFPAHAHLNLLGWVSLFPVWHLLSTPSLAGPKSGCINPSLDLDRSHNRLGHWRCGLVHTGHENGDPIAAVGSFVVFGDMLLFGWLLYKSEREPVARRSS